MTSQQPPARVLSVNVGRARQVGDGARSRTSGIDKRPVPVISVRDPGERDDPATTRLSGVEGDEVRDRRHHGGSDQAVYVVAREQLDHWQRVLGRELGDGMFGENMTTVGVDIDEAPVGAVLHVGGEVVLEVRGPRMPCATFATHLGERGWVRRFTDHAHPGAYCAVRTPGRIRPGDAVRLAGEPDHGVTVRTVFAAYSSDLDAAREVLAARCLAEADHAALAMRVQRRTHLSG